MDRVQRSLFDVSIPGYGSNENNALTALTDNSIGMVGQMGSTIFGIFGSSSSNDNIISAGMESGITMKEIDNNNKVAGGCDGRDNVIRGIDKDSDDLESFRLPSHTYRVPSLHANVTSTSSSYSSSSSSSNIIATGTAPSSSMSNMPYQTQSWSTTPQNHQQQQQQQQQQKKHSNSTISTPYAMGMYLPDPVPVPALSVVGTKKVRQRGFFGYLSWTLVHLLTFIVCFEVGTRMWVLLGTPKVIEADESNTNSTEFSNICKPGIFRDPLSQLRPTLLWHPPGHCMSDRPPGAVSTI